MSKTGKNTAEGEALRTARPTRIWERGWFRWLRLVLGLGLLLAGNAWKNDLASDSAWPLLWMLVGLVLMASFRYRGRLSTRWSRSFRKYS